MKGSVIETNDLGGIGPVYAVRHAELRWTRPRSRTGKGHRTARIAMPRYVKSDLSEICRLNIRNMVQVVLWAVANALPELGRRSNADNRKEWNTRGVKDLAL